MEGPPRESRPQGLAPWVLLPIGGLLLIVVAITGLPDVDCDGTQDPGSAGEIVLVVLTAAASLCCVVGAAQRTIALARAGADPSTLLAIGALGVAAVVFSGTILARGGPDRFWSALFVGMAVTALALLALIVAWFFSKSADEAGPLVPVYLLGAGLFVYPGFTLLALALTSGALC